MNYAIKQIENDWMTFPISKKDEWQIILQYAILTDNIAKILINAVSLQIWFKEQSIQCGQLNYISAIIFEFTDALNKRIKRRASE